MRRHPRGMTLVELLMAVAITSIVMVVAVAVVVAGARLARTNEQIVAANVSARMAMTRLQRDLRLAGMGAPGGIYVDHAGSVERINAVFGNDDGTGTDELWLVVPRSNVLGTTCGAPGNASVVLATGTGVLGVKCNDPALVAGGTALVSNMTTAALLTNIQFPTATTLDYDESATAGFASAPEKGVFQQGDMVYQVEIVHYKIAAGPNGRPQLVRSIGAVNAAAGAPFTDPDTDFQTYQDVEDLQVAYGTGTDAATLTFGNGLGPVWDPSVVLQSLRVTLVGVSRQTVTEDPKIHLGLGPVAVEDHAPPATPDGYRRSIFRRRVELANLSAVNL